MKHEGQFEPPWLVPIPIPTDTRWEKFKSLFAKRRWMLGRDWYFRNSQGIVCVIPGAFVDKEATRLRAHYFTFDGKSYPRIFWIFFSLVGIGLTEGIVHDFAYTYRGLIAADGTMAADNMTRRECDRELYDVGMRVNGMWLSSFLSWAAVRLFGSLAWWNGRRVGLEDKLPDLAWFVGGLDTRRVTNPKTGV